MEKELKHRYLKNINLSIVKGSFNSIIGASGSGKTTLLNIIGMLDRPTSGQVELEGKRIDKMSRRALASIRHREIGFVFQFHYLLPEFNAIENVLMPANHKKYVLWQENKRKSKRTFGTCGTSKS